MMAVCFDSRGSPAGCLNIVLLHLVGCSGTASVLVMAPAESGLLGAYDSFMTQA